MRLLKLEGNNSFSLGKGIVNPTTPYAILSHTWGDDDDEVNFRDLTLGLGDTKAGYRKLRFCREQAASDGLEYFWVDTCCIDKSNNAELSEAINSMFRWYRNATKCYVYLTDVSMNDHDETNLSLLSWEVAFRKSRWFSRGWTLQELIAPPSVEFFCLDGKLLGDKKSLERQVHEITGIATSALQGTPLFEFSVDERMSWAKNRKTTREEDKAYSLLGIFDIHMPLIYGEGMKSATNRLREAIDTRVNPQGGNPLDCLPYASEAPFNSYERQNKPICLDNTRIEILHQIYGWADGQDERCIFWLNGLAGTGKSTIARTIARKYFNKQQLGASFFFTKGGGDVSHASKFVTSIAVQLSSNIPSLFWHIRTAVIERTNIASQSLRDQWHHLVLRPLSKLDDSSCHLSYVLVVDALDECDDDDNVRVILQLLAEARSLQRGRLRVFLTSRPEIPIRHGFNQIPDTERQDFVLHSISTSIIDHDISIFFKYKLGLIGQERSLNATWPGEKVIDFLVQAAGGLFIWAATACRFISEGKRFTVKRLDTILKSSGTAITAPEKHLDEIYSTVLKHSIASEYTAEEIEESCYMLKQILGSAAVVFSPLSVCSLSRMLCITEEDIYLTLEELHSILYIPKDPKRPLRLHHPSFRDFLLDNNRCQDLNFWVNEKQVHQMLVDGCIQIMSTSLKQDICCLNIPGMLVADVEKSRVEHSLPPEVQYSCLYWIRHLQKSGTQLYDNDKVHQFLQKHLLHWLEALGWLGKFSEGIHAITSLESISFVSNSPDLYAFIRDIKRFALYSQQAVEQTPLQLYCSALIFSPKRSVRDHFKDKLPRWIQRLPHIENDWNALLQTIEGHTAGVSAVVFSNDCTRLASASYDQTVRLWDATTGASLQILRGHTGMVTSVAFSTDGIRLASASSDNTVRLWDVITGAALQTIKGHRDLVTSVAFSPDGIRLASSSYDKTVRLWGAATGASHQILKGHTEDVTSVAFSTDGIRLASASSDDTVRLWDVITGAALQIFIGHSRTVTSVAFSPDSIWLASASDDKALRLWDATTGASLQILRGHTDTVKSIAFSPDGKRLASASYDKTVQLCDIRTGLITQTFGGHTEGVLAVAFSNDGIQLASASMDQTIRRWDVEEDAALPILKGHISTETKISFSTDGSRIASARNKQGGVELWDATTGILLQTLKGHKGRVSTIVFSSDGTQLASASYQDMYIQLWNARTGTLLQTLKGLTGGVLRVVFSSDGTRIASVSFKDRTVQLWDARTGVLLHIPKSGMVKVDLVALSNQGTQLALFAGYKRKIELRDTTTGVLSQGFDVGNDVVTQLVFSNDGAQLASASYDKMQLWDTITGTWVLTLEMFQIESIAFSTDDTQLVSASNYNTIWVCDTATGAVLQKIKGLSMLSFISESPSFATGAVSSYRLRENGSWITWNDHKILWLPPDYRSRRAFIKGNIYTTISSGRVIAIQFKEGANPIGGAESI